MATVPSPVLHPGDKGPAVRKLQQALTALGYDVGRVDGRFGPRTVDALKWFQASAGLAADGLYGRRTEDALQARLASTAVRQLAEGRPR